MATLASPYNVTLACDGGGWVGTFGLTVAFLVEDILSDGEGFDARVTWEDGQGDLHIEKVRIEKPCREGDLITTTGKIEHEDIRKMEI